MEQSFIVGGRKFIVSGVSGKVLSENRTNTTHVSGKVSSDHFGGVQGRIRSHTTVEQEVWISRDDNGNDFVIRFPSDIPLREGQNITAVSIEDNRLLHWVFLRNEATSTNYQILDSWKFLQVFFGSFFGCIGLFFLGLLAGVFFAISLVVFLVCLALFLLLGIVMTIQNKKRRAMYMDAVQRALDARGIAFTVK